jgi:hypothetical protein
MQSDVNSLELRNVRARRMKLSAACEQKTRANQINSRIFFHFCEDPGSCRSISTENKLPGTLSFPTIRALDYPHFEINRRAFRLAHEGTLALQRPDAKI